MWRGDAQHRAPGAVDAVRQAKRAHPERWRSGLQHQHDKARPQAEFLAGHGRAQRVAVSDSAAAERFPQTPEAWADTGAASGGWDVGLAGNGSGACIEKASRPMPQVDDGRWCFPRPRWPWAWARAQELRAPHWSRGEGRDGRRARRGRRRAK